MDRREKTRKLISLLLEEEPEYRQQAAQFPQDMESQWRLLRSLMNVRYPGKHLNLECLRLQDELLAEEREERGVVDVMELSLVNTDSRISVWQGDITRLRADAIVNAANSQMLGCFIPCHACIDNAIHSAAGLQPVQYGGAGECTGGNLPFHLQEDSSSDTVDFLFTEIYVG